MRGPQFCLALIQSSHFYLGVTIRMKAQLFRSIESSLRLFTYLGDDKNLIGTTHAT